MSNSKYLQKMFFLLVMGFSLSFVYACGDDEDDEPFTENTGGGSTDNSGNGDVPNDSTSSGEGEGLPQDSTSVGDEEYPQDSAFVGGEEYPQDSTFNDSVFGGDEPIVSVREAVDLGLSVKWATCNVGASSPEDFGGYYAWGETEEKDIYTVESYDYYNDSIGRYEDIGQNISGTKYDVAHVQWGENWRMPTSGEVKELYSECTWEWTIRNGVSGQLVTGPNGNNIFLPAAGYRRDSEADSGSYGYYWSASPVEHLDNDAYSLYFYDGHKYWGNYCHRYGGHPVRPVTNY